MQKAKQAANTSKLLFDCGDFDGVCNRAYYSMFISARVMLDIFGRSPRTHRGVVRLFREAVVLGGHVNPQLAKLFARNEYARNVADYERELTSR